MDRREFIKAGMAFAMVGFGTGCAGPTTYDFSKFGEISRIGVLDSDENNIDFWADIDRDGNIYSRLGANGSIARRFSKHFKGHLGNLYPTFFMSMLDTFKSQDIRASLIHSSNAFEGKGEGAEPLLLECKVHIGFVLAGEGIMPSATVINRVLEKDKTCRFERGISIGRGKPLRNFDEPVQVVGVPSKRYPSEAYVLEHLDEVSSDLIEMATQLGRSSVQLLLKQGVEKS
jgi:hypothetical protein